MEVVDVAVIGGGPAGASAAREAAQRGLSVLLFDMLILDVKLVEEVFQSRV